MQKIEFVIDGEPEGKGRPRSTKAGHMYTPKQTKDYEAHVIDCFRRDVPEFVRWEKGIPLRLRLKAYYKIPASTPVRQRAQMLEGIIRPTKKPDYDNIAKIVCDALNGVAWYDDAQITNGGVVKRYSEYPRVEVEISEDK